MGHNPSEILGFKQKGLKMWTSQDRSDPLILHYGKIKTAINPARYLSSTFMAEKPRIGLGVADGQLLARADCHMGLPQRLALGRLLPEGLGTKPSFACATVDVGFRQERSPLELSASFLRAGTLGDVEVNCFRCTDHRSTSSMRAFGILSDRSA